MNDFTSFTYAAHLATFLIYVQINAGPDRALEKYNLKGKKKEREGRGFIARHARFSRPNLWSLCRRERGVDRVTNVFLETRIGWKPITIPIQLPSKDSFNSGYWQNYICFKYIYIRNDDSKRILFFDSFYEKTFLNLIENGRYKKKR